MQGLATTLVLAAALIGGCTSTRYVQRPQAVEEIQPLYTKARFHMTLVHERPVGATSAAPTSLALARDPAAVAEAVPLVDLSNLHGYRIKRRGLGALEGLGWGTAIGVFTGAAIGASLGSDSHCMGDGCYDISFSAGEKAVALGIIGGITGMVLGPVIGMLIGHTDEYVFGIGPVVPVRGPPPMPAARP